MKKIGIIEGFGFIETLIAKIFWDNNFNSYILLSTSKQKAEALSRFVVNNQTTKTE